MSRYFSTATLVLTAGTRTITYVLQKDTILERCPADRPGTAGSTRESRAPAITFKTTSPNQVKWLLGIPFFRGLQLVEHDASPKLRGRGETGNRPGAGRNRHHQLFPPRRSPRHDVRPTLRHDQELEVFPRVLCVLLPDADDRR